MDDTIVIYHGECPDGFAAAWVFWTLFEGKGEYLPYSYGQSPPDVTDKTVIVVDFSFPRNVVLEMIDKAHHLVLLDHHTTAEEDLKDIDTKQRSEIIFDMKRSGAQIAWDYVSDKYGYPKVRPIIIDYVGDRDLWQHKLYMTYELNEAFHFLGCFQDFSTFNRYSKLKDIEELINIGSIVLKVRRQEVRTIAKAARHAFMITPFSNHHIKIACCPRHIRSDVGAEICKDLGAASYAVLYWYDFENDEWWISLRSGTQIDVSSIAKSLGGGGHQSAAGFTIKGVQNFSKYFSQVVTL